MWLTEIAVKRPLLVVAFLIAIVFAGVQAYVDLGIDLFPQINTPIVTTTIVYPGAGPEEVEELVTKPVEDAIAALNDIDTLSSVSTEGFSAVTVTFTERANPATIATEVERRVNAIRNTLPPETEAPTVVKADFNALPVPQLALSGDRPPEQLFRLADNEIRPRLEGLPGVATVQVLGGLKQEVQVKVDPRKLQAYGVTLDQVRIALASANASVPGGALAQGDREYTLRLYALYDSPERMADLVVAGSATAPVKLGALAEVVLTTQRRTQIARFNGRDTVVLAVTKQSGANATDVADEVKGALSRLQAALPPGVQLAVVQDSSTFIRQSLREAERTLIEAVLLTGLVLLLFLHTLRSTFIVLISIPTSLLATFLVMALFGFTLNVMSTLALALTIGILVDDSIVVLENIYRHLNLGESPIAAAINGRSEIGLAALTITLVDVVVFTPVAFLTGITGGFFREFGGTVATATLFSLLVSFTLTPMLASRWLRAGQPGQGRGAWNAWVRGWEAGFARLSRGYRRLLGWALRHRPLVVGLSFASLVLGLALIPLGLVKVEFFPQTDQGELTVVSEQPAGISLTGHDAVVRQVEEVIRGVPEVTQDLALIGVSPGAFSPASSGQTRFARLNLRLVEKRERHRGVEEIAADLRERLKAVRQEGRLRVELTGGPGGNAQPIQVRVQGRDPRQLTELAATIERALAGIPGLTDIANSGAAGLPELRVLVDRQRAADLGVTPAQIGLLIRTAYEGEVVTKFRPGGQDELDVRLLAVDDLSSRREALPSLPISRSGGPPVLLSQVARIEEVRGPAQIDRVNRERVITISGSLQGRSLGEVSAQVRRLLAQLPVPAGYSVELVGQAQQQQESFRDLFRALGLSVLLMYLLMVVLYDSLLYPLVIMFSLPVSIVGAILGLYLTRNTINLISLIGVILLMGLVTKNGILLVDYTNTLRRQGLDRAPALLEAGPTRLRPIIMTSLTIALAMVPLILGLGEGAELRAPLAAVVLGGIISSTLLTLVLVPVVYTYADDLQRRLARLVRRGADAAAQPAPMVPARDGHELRPMRGGAGAPGDAEP